MDYAWWQCIIKTNLWLLVAGFFKYTCCMVFIFDYENAICIFDILFFFIQFKALLLNEWPKADQAAVQKKFIQQKSKKLTQEDLHWEVKIMQM